MEGNLTLIVWSTVALTLRVLALIVFVYVLRLAFFQLRKKDVYDGEHNLKLLLFHMILFTCLSNLPIVVLHVQRINSIATAAFMTAFATVTNAASMLIIAVLLYLIYRD